MLNLSVGPQVEIDGESFIRAEPGRVGHPVYGPYVRIAPGAYRVTFTMALAEGANADSGEICAIVEVVSDYGRTGIAFDFVTTSQLSFTPAPIDLYFNLAETRELEFRVYVRGREPLLIADEPLLSPIGEDIRIEPPSLAQRALRHLFEQDAAIRPVGDAVSITVDRDRLPQILSFSDPDRDVLAQQIVRMVGYRGDE